MRALISVSDKTGIVDFATALKNLGWDLIATGDSESAPWCRSRGCRHPGRHRFS